MAVVEQRTFCRICEAHCGLVAEVEDGQVVKMRPDRDHPVSRGYSCVKGLALPELHRDPDRVNQPLKRAADGTLEPISWEQALAEIGGKVRALRKQHGKRSVGMYTGNPSFFSLQHVLYSAGFLEALGSPNLFASHSVDANNKFHVSTAMYGQSVVHPIPDFDRCELFVCLGSNPVVSQMSILCVPDSLGKLQAIEARGGRVVTIDPRRTETAAKVGEHLFVRPGTDAYLLMAILHVVAIENPIDLDPARAVADGVDEFVEVARDWTPERVAPITGIDAAVIRELANAYRTANGAVLYMSTGVNMGPFGSIAYWLIQGLALITGNLDAAGGLLVPRGPFDIVKLAAAVGLGSFDEHRTLVGDWHRVAGCFPVAALADEITVDHPERIRALFITAGNPVHSMPGGDRLRDALRELDLLVSIDMYVNESAADAHYILPATDMLERSDFPISHANLQPTPHAQWTPAVVPPTHERREEWQIFSDLARACGAPVLGASVCNALPRLNRLLSWVPGLRPITPNTLLALLLRWGGDTTLAELKKNPAGVMLPETQPGSFLGKRVPAGNVRLAPSELVADVSRLADRAPEFEADDGKLRLIGRRERKSHNSWMHNNRRIKQPEGNVALLNPADARARDIADGDHIEIVAGDRRLELPVKLTEDVGEGVICVPHGWDHAAARLPRASALGGGNVNTVIPGGPEQVEPISGQAIMVSHAVDVRRAARADAKQSA